MKLLLGTEIRLPNSLIKSMKDSFYLQPFENLTEKYSELTVDLRSKIKFLNRDLTDLTKSRHETNPFPYMKGLPDGDHSDFEEVDFYADEVNNKFASYLYKNMVFSLLEESDSDEESLNEDSSEHSSVKVDCNTSIERFSAKLRRLRGTIYQKIGKRKILNTDLDKYEQLVDQFVRKFGDRELSKWEVWIWQKKVVKTRTDAFNASFDDHLEVSENLSDVSNLELSLQNHNRNDGVKIHKPRAKNFFFGKQGFLKDFFRKPPMCF